MSLLILENCKNCAFTILKFLIFQLLAGYKNWKNLTAHIIEFQIFVQLPTWRNFKELNWVTTISKTQISFNYCWTFNQCILKRIHSLIILVPSLTISWRQETELSKTFSGLTLTSTNSLWSMSKVYSFHYNSFMREVTFH